MGVKHFRTVHLLVKLCGWVAEGLRERFAWGRRWYKRRRFIQRENKYHKVLHHTVEY